MLLNKCVLYNLVEGKNLFLPIQIHITLHVAEHVCAVQARRG